MYRVAFSVKCIEKNDPNYRLLMDRVQECCSFSAAVEFSRAIARYIAPTQELVGKPYIERAA